MMGKESFLFWRDNFLMHIKMNGVNSTATLNKQVVCRFQ